MDDGERRRLAVMQRGMVETLVGDASRAPALEAAGAVLKGKREREATLAGPVLAEALGVQFSAAFQQYVEVCGYPRCGGPSADAAAFGRWLQRRGELPGSAMGEAAVLRARVRFPVQIILGKGRMAMALRIGARVWVRG